ncbi:conserved hypothetical protein [Sphingomonas aurantiaca]|uniref:Uncharacterized protein n=2 Tax=Sphingomonas aurantiaca TaxID=185949 RepID=A0A5E8AEE4_9SPHN|nr:conserved hypothetical protein [Sphingomonas aurantiaca]
MGMTRITDARITFIAGDCFTDHLEEGYADDIAFTDGWAYDDHYNQVRGAGHPDYEMAWRDSQKSSFWRHYLGDSPGNVPAETAWKQFVPLRLIEDHGVVETDRGERVLVDAFGYQFGMVVAITVHVAKHSDFTIDSWVDRLRELRLGRAFQIDGRPATLTETLSRLLDDIRQEAFPHVASGTRSAEPISVNMVLQAADGEPAQAVDTVLQRQLHAVTAWPADWRNAVLPPIGQEPAFLAMRGRNQVPGDALYAAPNGRTAWRPGLFRRHRPQDGPQRRHTLSCLGHNLVAGAVQTEMLRLLAVRVANVPATRRHLDMGILRRVGWKLDQLRRGKGTYRSSSVKLHVEEASSRAEVNDLLAAADAPLIPNP